MLIHAVPSFVEDSFGAGNWKDIKARSLLWPQLGVASRTIYFDKRNAEELVESCTPETTDVVLEYTRWPWLVEAIKRHRGSTRVHVRAHNAEALQQIHREPLGLVPNPRNLRNAGRFVKALGRDFRCTRAADSVLGISEWDNRRYWRFLTASSSLRYLPYYCPWPDLGWGTPSANWDDREPWIVCMPAGNDAIAVGAIRGFERFASRVGPVAGHDWRFALTGGLSSRQRSATRSDVLDELDHIDDPWGLLCRVRAVAMLSDLGFGMKTTIVDALAAGCHVLVATGLYRRLPESIRPLCISLDPEGDFNVKLLMARLADSPPPHDLNKQLKSQAIKVLGDVLGAMQPATEPQIRVRT